jgi:hypothetical protein
LPTPLDFEQLDTLFAIVERERRLYRGAQSYSARLLAARSLSVVLLGRAAWSDVHAAARNARSLDHLDTWLQRAGASAVTRGVGGSA